ncbi:glycine-rich protein, partial [Candidatus Saccharibacteria bacterium]|nr:glycine-rich protein [Candidatus Saccharibacteria bacterium]
MFTITSIRTSILDGLRGWRRHPKLFVGSASGIIAAVMVFVFLAVTRAAPGDITLSPPTGPASGGTSVTMTASPGWTGQTVDFPFGGSGGTTGLMQSFTAPVAGLYKLEVWGAQGGNAPSGGQGGRGGYSTVTVQLNANQVIYIASGGQGGAASGTTGTGGWNGGGNTNSNAGGGGGGASHISLNTATTATPLSDNNVRTNLLVAAGGGGGTQTAGVAGCHGGWGGGTTGGSSQTNVGGGGACTGNGASGGTQTAGGTTLASQGASGTAGIGATSTQQGGSIYGGGGGGGWFGGGASNGTGGGGGGGSGWLRTAALNGVAITNAQTLAGNASFLEPNGTATVGHVGNGYARVTILAPGLYVKPVVQFGTQGGTTTTIPDVNVTWCNYDGSICTNGGAPNTVTFTTPARGSMPQTVDAWLAFDPSKTGEFTYWTPATNYAQQCSTDGGTTWDYRRNIYSGTGSGPPVTGALCRLKLDNAFSGTIVLNDGYSAINPGLSGTFGQGSGPYNDTRFDPSTRTFTVDYTDTYNTAGQYLYYTYNSPDWSTLISYWTVSNQAALMQPSISVTPVPNSGVPNIVQAGDAQAFWIYANSYEILHADNTITLSAGSEVPFQVTTYGALYTGTITITEDLSQSDDPSGTAGSFRQNPMTFSGNGQPQTFFYTPETTTIAQTTNHITLDGASSPAITDDDIDVQVVPAAMRLDGPTNLSRGEYGEYTLTIYDTSISSVALADLINGMSSAGGTFVDTTAAPYDATFTSGTSTYDTTSCTTITIPADPGCERTFRYTVDPGLSHNASYIVINATGDVTDTFASINVTINADALEFACGPSSPNCTIAYVNETSEYTVSPDGIFTGSTTITSPDSGATINFVPGGTASTSWADDAGTKVFNYTPSTPGRYVLSAVTTSTNSAMNQT